MSDQPPQYPQMPYQPQPEKKRSWFARHKILTTLGVLVILSIIFGGGASGGSDTGGDNSVTGSQSASSSDDQAVSDSTSDETTSAPKPKGNVVGNWLILTKHPKFGKEYGMFKTVKIDVKNISDSEDEPWLEIRLTKGNRLVTTFDCLSNTVRPGEVTTLDCSSMDDYAPFTKYEIKNAV